MKLNLILLDFLRKTENSIPGDVSATSDYLLQIYLPVIVWLVLVLILIIILLKKYTLANWTEKRRNPYEKESMGLPRGTFRSILTLTLLFVAVILELVSVHTVGFEENVKEFLTAFQMMIAFYFGSKVLHHMTNTDRDKAGVSLKEEIERKERIEAAQKEEQLQETPPSNDVKEQNATLAEMYDDGHDEAMEEDNAAFNNEDIEIGGDDPDAKG